MKTRPIWPKASSGRVDSALSAHSLIGLIVGGLIYVLCLSGTLAVFEDELEWWEDASAPAVAAVTPEAAQKAAQTLFSAREGELSHLNLFLPREDWPRFVASTDEETRSVDAAGAPTGHHHAPWNAFLIDLHYYLHLPSIIGITLVGSLGAMLLALVLSGLLAHPRIFRDAFAFRRGGSARLTQADLHNRLSVWLSPFFIAVALTGAMIGLFTVVGYLVAQAGFGGDILALYAVLFGEEPAPNPAAAPLADIATALRTMKARFPEAIPFWIIVHEPGTLGQHVQVLAEHPQRLIYAEYYNFDGDGAFVSRTGMSDGALGQQIASSVYRVHFGYFGGFWVKAAYGVFGLCLCAVVATGLNLYFLKRERQGRPAPRLRSVWTGLVWGTPALLAATFAGSVAGLLPPASLVPAFWAGLAALLLWAAITPAGRVRLEARAAAGLCLLLIVPFNVIMRMPADAPLLLHAVSAVLALAALWLLRPVASAAFGKKDPAGRQGLTAPAE